MVKRLKASKHLDEQSECRYRFVKTATEHFVPHCHEYYEIFLTTGGSAIHFVNGISERITGGYLIFVRKDDEHDYKNYDADFEMVNLAFSENTLNLLFSYLGEGFPSRALLESPLPPTVRLSDSETRSLYMKFARLNTVNFTDKAKLKFEMRVLLADVFAGYFADIGNTAGETGEKIPFWLENAYEKMKIPKNFIEGKNKFFDLAGVSREHATRCLKKYYNITPSEYVNDLRLSYAANLFLASNLNAADVCYECGFQNLSWFYNAFSSKFGVPPAKYRELYKAQSLRDDM